MDFSNDIGATWSIWNLDVARSFDGGESWKPSPPIYDRVNRTAVHDSPSIANVNGTLVVTWESNENIGGSGNDTDIVMATSTDLGESWSSMVVVTSETGTIYNDSDPSLAVSGSTLYLTWYQESQNFVPFKMSKDTGTTWSETVFLQSSMATCNVPPEITADANRVAVRT